MKNWKMHAVVLVIIIVSELIGLIRFSVGPGTVILLPMMYALLMGLALTPKGLNLMKSKDMDDASGLITVSLMLLMARYGTLVGPTLPKIISAGPALLLQEFGNLGTIFIGVPLAIWLGLKRETIGAAHSVAREPNVALIGDIYGLDGAEGRGVMGIYICGTVIGTIFFALLASFLDVLKIFHPYSLAMACGVGSASMMTASAGVLASIYPAMKDQILALAAASNMLSGLDGLYMSLWMGLPLTEWLYKKLYPLKYGVPAPKREVKK